MELYGNKPYKCYTKHLYNAIPSFLFQDFFHNTKPYETLRGIKALKILRTLVEKNIRKNQKNQEKNKKIKKIRKIKKVNSKNKKISYVFFQVLYP